MVIKILNWAGDIPNQPFYGFVGNIRTGTGHVRGLWRLRLRQENPAARKQANLQQSDHQSLLFMGWTNRHHDSRKFRARAEMLFPMADNGDCLRQTDRVALRQSVFRILRQLCVVRFGVSQ